MKQISAKELNLSIENIDFKKYALIIRETEIDDPQRLYFICSRESISERNDTVNTYIAVEELHKIKPLWIEAKYYCYDNRIAKELYQDDFSILNYDENNHIVTEKYLAKCGTKKIKDLIEVIN